MAVTITITDAGRAAIVNAENTGADPVTIAEIGLGDGSYTTAPDATATALQNEIKRLTTISGEIVAADTFHVTVKDETNDTYDVTEFGLYLADGTLFAIYASTAGVLSQKAAASALLLAVDIVLTTVNATSLTFGDTSFTNPPASETDKGVVELATATETQTGTDNTRAVTPASLSARTATESRTGLAEVATQAETDAGTDDSRFVTPKKMQKSGATHAAHAGAVAAYAMDSPPIGWLKANGASISRTSYAALFAAIGTTFGAGDGSTTFNLPDLRGEFLRGWDDGRGADSGRSFASVQADEFKLHGHPYRHNAELGSVYVDDTGGFMTNGDSTETVSEYTGSPGNFDQQIGGSGGTETRPRNVALLYCIKY
ncbi:tail fiber protein [Guyparkeria sp. GHLCS8-2]|uniref:tail fiber protein n=1 Tax=Guyparkeria halopsychrophila TaxID=3139421 RepID=UPI0037CCB75D